jgi:hypothetical protein
VCTAGVNDGDIYQPQPEQGYWIDRIAVYYDPTLMQEVYKCPRPEVCLSQSIETNSSSTSSGDRRRLSVSKGCALLENYNATDCAPTLSCKKGSTGPLCGACEDNWRYSSSSKKCEKCGDVLNWVEAFLMMSVVAVLVAIVFALRSGDVNIPSSMHFLCGAKLHIPFIGMLYHLESGTIKVMWSTFQIVQSISFNLSVNYPDPYSSIISYFSFFELDFLSVDCFKGGYLLSVLIATVVPILVALICWVVYLFRLVYFNALSFSEIDGWASQSKEMFAQHVHASLLIIYVFVPPVANKQFKALDCQDLADGQSYLRADTSVDATRFLTTTL